MSVGAGLGGGWSVVGGVPFGGRRGEGPAARLGGAGATGLLESSRIGRHLKIEKKFKISPNTQCKAAYTIIHGSIFVR